MDMEPVHGQFCSCVRSLARILCLYSMKQDVSISIFTQSPHIVKQQLLLMSRAAAAAAIYLFVVAAHLILHASA